MSLKILFDNSYAQLPDAFYARVAPEQVSKPSLIAYNEALAKDLGIAGDDEAEIAQILGGNEMANGSEPIAQIYAGHQFGSFNPQLGDGRAILLGEVRDKRGTRFDIQLKGSGRTPFSRNGDGRAWLGPVLREYVVSEAMHALGIPTTRALAAVHTGDVVYREGAMPGAVFTRVAASHLRVGTFQLFAHRGQTKELKQLTEYAIARHYPEADGPLGFLECVVQAQSRLIAQWMSKGFIHGVMNTDNCTISGETIDYGPCAFMDTYAPDTVFSSIDRTGRYAFGNQPRIAVWNMAQLATALIQQLEDPEVLIEDATRIIHGMPDLIEAQWLQLFGEKVGISHATQEDLPLIEGLLVAMAQGQADFTNTYAALTSETARDQFTDPTLFETWETGWRERLAREDNPEQTMRGANPLIIPRNHQIEAMIQAAVAGDYEPFHRLNTALSAPFGALPDEFADLQRPPTPDQVVPATFCGT